MLPNNDDLVLDFENEDEKTQTFEIRKLTKTQTIPSTLGQGALGKLRLGAIIVGSELNTTHYIGGKIDELDALIQSIYLMLSIEADQFIIYPHTYGLNTLDLIGKPYYYVVAVLPERLKETLLRDSRITDVSDFEFNVNKNKITCRFIVHTIYGNLNEETEVSY